MRQTITTWADDVWRLVHEVLGFDRLFEERPEWALGRMLEFFGEERAT